MRTLLCTVCAGLVLASCQDQSQTISSTNETSTGAVAFRVPAQVVAVAKAYSDSIQVSVVPLAPVGTTQVKIWPLVEGEILFEKISTGKCSVFVALTNPLHQSLFQGKSLVDIKPGRTTSTDIPLSRTSGSLSVNVSVDPTIGNIADPAIVPEPGNFINSVLVTLTHPVATTKIQYRIENATTGNTSAWSNYSSAFTLSQTSVVFVRAVNGTDTGSFRTYSYFINSNLSPVLNNFENGWPSAPGWNGNVFAVGSASAKATGNVLRPGPWGTGSAHINFTLDGLGFTSLAGADFNNPATPIDYTRFKDIRIKIRSNVGRMFTFRLRSSLPAYATSYNAGAGLGIEGILVGASTNEIVLNRASFVNPSWYTGSIVSLTDILPTITGLDVMTVCPNSLGCSQVNGTIDIDDIVVNLN